MKLICAGLSKTGTKSVASALRILGYNVHDLEEQWRYHLDEYVDALEGKGIPDFATMYGNVDAVTDSPAYLFWKEISAAFSDAKVVLMVRDSEEVWFESWLNTVSVSLSAMSSYWMRLGFRCSPTGRKWKRLLDGSGKKMVEGFNSYTLDTFRKVYSRHNARISASVPQDQLLVYNVKQGWKPLCEFLGVEVPDVSFPRLNVNSESIGDIFFTSHLYKRMTKELCVILAFIVLVSAFLVYWLQTVYH